MKRFLRTHGEAIIYGLFFFYAVGYLMCVKGPEADRVAQVASK